MLRTHSDRLTDAISTNLYKVTDALYAKELITLDTKRDMYSSVTGENESKKAGKLVIELQTQLESSLTPDHCLINICRVLINQQHQTLKDIATNILHQLGECACVCDFHIIVDHEKSCGFSSLSTLHSYSMMLELRTHNVCMHANIMGSCYQLIIY